MWHFKMDHPTIVYYVCIFGYLGVISLWATTTTSLFCHILLQTFCRMFANLLFASDAIQHKFLHRFCRIFVIFTNAVQQKFHIFLRDILHDIVCYNQTVLKVLNQSILILSWKYCVFSSAFKFFVNISILSWFVYTVFDDYFLFFTSCKQWEQCIFINTFSF